MKKVVLKVNADDFGFDENRTRAILAAFRMGAISQTTAMVNMPYFDQAVEMVRSAGILNRMGLHLNLTEGPAMTSAMRNCRFFCDKDGCFTGAFHRTARYRFFLPHKLQLIVQGEIEAQVERFLSSGSTFHHLDSHHHVHTNYSIARIALPIVKANGFSSIRLSRNWGDDISLPKKIYKKVWNHYFMKHIKGVSEYFTDFRGLRNGLHLLPSGSSFEVMVHPMFGNRTGLDLNGALTDSGRLISEELAFYKANEEIFDFHGGAQ